MAVNLDMTRLTDWNSWFLTVIFPILVKGKSCVRTWQRAAAIAPPSPHSVSQPTSNPGMETREMFVADCRHGENVKLGSCHECRASWCHARLWTGTGYHDDDYPVMAASGGYHLTSLSADREICRVESEVWRINQNKASPSMISSFRAQKMSLQ